MLSNRPLSSFYTDITKSLIQEGEVIFREAKAQRARIPVYELQRTPAGDSMRWAMNLVDIDLACTERLLQEMKAAKVLGVVEKLMAEMRKNRLRMPRDVDNALSVFKTLKASKVESLIAKKLSEVKTLDELVEFAKPEGTTAFAGSIGLPICALPGCTKTPRENSVYCNDKHRVDMARLKAKQRAQASKAQAAK